VQSLNPFIEVDVPSSAKPVILSPASSDTPVNNYTSSLPDTHRNPQKATPIFINYTTVISELNISISEYDFLRDYPRLTEENYSKYHTCIKRLGFFKLSQRIDECLIHGIGLDCSSGDHRHYKYAPIPCKRRTCPQCASIEMIDRVLQFSPLVHYLHHDLFDPRLSYRLRFWTLTAKGVPIGNELTDFIKSLKSALHLFWRKLFGDNSKKPDPEAGGVWFFETQGEDYWCPHIHGLVWSKFHHVKVVRPLWYYCLKYYGLHGDRIELDELTGDNLDKVVREIVSYPIDPDKLGRHDQALLANIEVALHGQRRYIIKGSFYGKFPRIEHKAQCPVCNAPMIIGEKYSRDRRGHIDLVRDMFPETLEGLQKYHDMGFISKHKRFLLESNIATIKSLC